MLSLCVWVVGVSVPCAVCISGLNWPLIQSGRRCRSSATSGLIKENAKARDPLCFFMRFPFRSFSFLFFMVIPQSVVG